MEQFIAEIIAYCEARKITPQNMLRDAINAKWGQWQSWVDRTSSPTMAVADRIREYMAQNPAPTPPDRSKP